MNTTKRTDTLGPKLSIKSSALRSKIQSISSDEQEKGYLDCKENRTD
jgi:hypothetical protein